MANHTLRLEPVVLLILVGIALVVSGIGPHDRMTWILEIAPVLMVRQF